MLRQITDTTLLLVNSAHCATCTNQVLTSEPASRPHAPQLPPLQSTLSPEGYYPQNATPQLPSGYGREPKSPRHPPASTQPLQQRGPIPKFQKCSRVSDLQPVINAQPPFRRANPEGGFLSVSTPNSESRVIPTDALIIAASSSYNTSPSNVQDLQSKFQI